MGTCAAAPFNILTRTIIEKVKIGNLQSKSMVSPRTRNRICNVTTIIEKKPRAIDISIIIVGEKLGL